MQAQSSLLSTIYHRQLAAVAVAGDGVFDDLRVLSARPDGRADPLRAKAAELRLCRRSVETLFSCSMSGWLEGACDKNAHF